MLYILFARQNQKSSRADIINGSFKNYYDFNNSKKTYCNNLEDCKIGFAQVFKCLMLFLPNDSLWVDNYWDSQAEKYLRAMYEKTTDIVAAQTFNSCVLCNCYRKIM